MARKNKRTVQYRRRREGKTNYKKRLSLLKSRSLRLIIRKFNKNTIAQLIEYHPEGDKVIASSNSRELVKYGWKLNRGNIPSAYLVGLLIGTRAKGKEAIVDLGLQRPLKCGKLYAVLKGAIDGGLKIEADESIFPSKERIEGKQITSYEKNKIEEKDFEKQFNEVKQKIMKG